MNDWQGWREMDSRCRRFGFILRKNGGDLYASRRHYRWLYPRREI